MTDTPNSTRAKRSERVVEKKRKGQLIKEFVGFTSDIKDTDAQLFLDLVEHHYRTDYLSTVEDIKAQNALGGIKKTMYKVRIYVHEYEIE